MFGHAFVGSGDSAQKTSSFMASLLLQTFWMGMALFVPLLYTGAVPMPRLNSALIEPPPPPPPAPSRTSAQPRAIKPAPRDLAYRPFVEPKRIPSRVADISDDQMPALAATVPGRIPGGGSGEAVTGVIDGIVRGLGATLPPPMPKDSPKENVITRIHVGGNVQAAKLIAQPKPPYPALARQARIHGTVRFTAVIGKDGTIQNLQLAGGHPLLVPAATDAVRQWRYRPTLLNNEPVEVITQIDVNFTLSQ